MLPTFDMEESFNVISVGLHLLHSRCNSAPLVAVGKKVSDDDDDDD